MKKLLKVQAWEKGGVKKLKLVEKRKAKKMEKENDLVESSQGSDSQLSEAENKWLLRTRGQRNYLFYKSLIIIFF